MPYRMGDDRAENDGKDQPSGNTQSGGAEVIHVNNLVTDVSRSVDELRSHLAAIIESSNDAIVSKDLNGVVQPRTTLSSAKT
jgi:hypothetical protein